jgi:Lysyl oxidase
MLAALTWGAVDVASAAKHKRHRHHHHHKRAHKRHKKKHRHHRHKRAHPAVTATGSTPAITPPPPPDPLSEGLFWNGPTVASGNVRDPSLCDTPAGPCFTYKLHVADPGARLRVAIDIPMRDDTFELDLLDPAGEQVASAATDNAFDAEAFAADPKAGDWTVRVIPEGVSDGSFRLRAKLERTIAKPTGHVALLPDLKAVPPMEFGFIAPANPANGAYPPDTVNPPLDVAGVHPLSCTADEMAPAELTGGAATKCLRFTSGPINVGAGPFEMHFSFVSDNLDGKTTPIGHGPMTQVIHYADATTTTRPAGTYSFHWLHGHFHDDHILDYQLFKVEDGDRLAAAGSGTKSGFCPANQLFGEWRRFVQAPPDELIGSGDTGTGNCQNPVDGVLGLSPGWGDVYRWQRPGQYVEFGTNPDGLYVVRTTVDVENQIQEADETNNSAYALVKVVGDTVRLLERGQGASPFDPGRTEFKGAGPASTD